MKIPAIKGKLGTTVFYTSQMTFEEISKYVSPVTEQLHKSKTLNDMIQRSLTSNVDNIVQYLKCQKDRFFNALVLAVYEGCPQWHELEVNYFTEPDTTYSNLGFLEFSGYEKIFPVDGQHRVEAIKKAISEDSSLKQETIAVIFIGHSVMPNGIAKTRRIFSTLNRYAKPVSMRDIIALDEDDIVAISTRALLENHSLFVGKNISTGLSKGIPNGDTKCFTTIIVLSECNRTLFACFLGHPSSKKIKDFIRVRPSEEKINDFTKYIKSFWDTVSQYQDIKYFLKSKDALRNSETGGNLLFRPVGLIPFVEACEKIHKKQQHINVSEIAKHFQKFDFSVNNELWEDILWNSSSRKMITNNKVLTKNIFIYIYDKNLLSNKELAKLKTDFQALKKVEDAFAILDKFILQK